MPNWTPETLRARRRKIERGADFWDKACDRDLLWGIVAFSLIIAGLGVLLLH